MHAWLPSRFGTSPPRYEISLPRGRPSQDAHCRSTCRPNSQIWPRDRTRTTYSTASELESPHRYPNRCRARARGTRRRPALTSVLVVDSSAQVAALCDAGTDGEWAAEQLMRKDLAAPELIMFETANILRRLELTDGLPSAEAGHAHSDLLDLRMTLWPYAPMAQSVWRLRGSITCYVAAHVALAEHLDAPLVTLDHRLAGTCGAACEIRTPR